MWIQREIQLVRPRGFHLITREVVAALPELADCPVGLLHVFMRHTSASLTLNENADPSVRADFETSMRRLVPDGPSGYTHTLEGPDDMPAHIKASLMGASVQIPVTRGALNLGTWQGIYFCEHRDHGGLRTLLLTLMGDRQGNDSD